eukprot:4020912-Amphidinium_carterae.1
MREQGAVLTQSWTDWQREKVAQRQQQKPLCAAGAPPSPPPKDEPDSEEEESSGEDMPDDLQIPRHPKGDNMYTRYECFVGGRGQNKIKCQRCTRKSD